MFRKLHPQAGARPGTLLIGPDASTPRIRVMQFSPETVTEQEVDDVSTLSDCLPPDRVTWIDVQGFGDKETLQTIAQQFHIHPLAMEDIVNVPQRPKAEAYSQQILIIARTVSLPTPSCLEAEQLSLIVGPNYVITFQLRYGDRLEPVRQRIGSPDSRLRSSGADYLAYALLDTAVDDLYPVLATMGEQLESLESQILSSPHPSVLGQINTIRNQLMRLRRTIWPQRDAVRYLLSGENPLMGENVRTFLRDTLDHCEQMADVVEMYRETATGLLNTYMSAVAHRSNEVMKVLTIISSIFVPMTFVAGVYGMNFENMPELGLAWSYPVVWGIMLTLAVGMLSYFWRKGWLRVSPLTGAGGGDSPAMAGGSLSNEGSLGRVHVLQHDSSDSVGPTKAMDGSDGQAERQLRPAS
jgi:magnesium transporter